MFFLLFFSSQDDNYLAWEECSSGTCDEIVSHRDISEIEKFN